MPNQKNTGPKVIGGRFVKAHAYTIGTYGKSVSSAHKFKWRTLHEGGPPRSTKIGSHIYETT